jgi:hypothetical protein
LDLWREFSEGAGLKNPVTELNIFRNPEWVEYHAITTYARFLSRMNFAVYWGVMQYSLMSDMFGIDPNPSGLEKIHGSKYPG